MTKISKAKYKVGAIGCGQKGTQTARAYTLNPLTEIVAAADTDTENLALFCGRFNVPGYTDYKEMLKNEKIDIASAILPVSVNPEVVIDCAQSGVKAITCEKPIAVTLEDADRMVEACRSRGIKFSAGDLDRNFADYWKAKEIIDAGEIGEVQSINILYGSGIEMSGGGCQLFSLMRMFAGDADVSWVIGWVADDSVSDYDQGVGGYVRFVNGVECFLHRSRNAKNGTEVLGSRGVFYSDGSFLHLWKADEGTERPTWHKLKKVEGVFSDSSIWEVPYEYDQAGWKWPGNRQMSTVQSMVDALEKDIAPRSDGDNGRKVLEIAIALRESHRRGHCPVRLPLEDRSLKIIPFPFRLVGKKIARGKEAYAQQISIYTKA